MVLWEWRESKSKKHCRVQSVSQTGWRSYVFSVGEHFFPAHSDLLHSLKRKKKAATHQTTKSGLLGLCCATAGAAILHQNSPLNFCSGHSDYVDSSHFSLCYISVSSRRLYSPLSLSLITVFPASAPSLPHPPQTAVSAHELSSLLLVFFHGSCSLFPS